MDINHEKEEENVPQEIEDSNSSFDQGTSEKFKCTECPETFSKESNLKIHTDFKHKKDNALVESENLYEEVKRDYELMANFGNGRTFECKECSRKFKSKHSLQLHKVAVHNFKDNVDQEKIIGSMEKAQTSPKELPDINLLKELNDLSQQQENLKNEDQKWQDKPEYLPGPDKNSIETNLNSPKLSENIPLNSPNESENIPINSPNESNDIPMNSPNESENIPINSSNDFDEDEIPTSTVRVQPFKDLEKVQNPNMNDSMEKNESANESLDKTKTEDSVLSEKLIVEKHSATKTKKLTTHCDICMKDFSHRKGYTQHLKTKLHIANANKQIEKTGNESIGETTKAEDPVKASQNGDSSQTETQKIYHCDVCVQDFSQKNKFIVHIQSKQHDINLVKFNAKKESCDEGKNDNQDETSKEMDEQINESSNENSVHSEKSDIEDIPASTIRVQPPSSLEEETNPDKNGQVPEAGNERKAADESLDAVKDKDSISSKNSEVEKQSVTITNLKHPEKSDKGKEDSVSSEVKKQSMTKNNQKHPEKSDKGKEDSISSEVKKQSLTKNNEKHPEKSNKAKDSRLFKSGSWLSQHMQEAMDKLPDAIEDPNEDLDVDLDDEDKPLSEMITPGSKRKTRTTLKMDENFENNITCNICWKTFSDEKYLIRHNNQVHSNNEKKAKEVHSCDICETRFNSKHFFKLHLKSKKLKKLVDIVYGCSLLKIM